MLRASLVFRSRAMILLAAVLILGVVLVSCKTEEPAPPEPPFQMPEMPGYAAMTIPPDNPMSTWKVELGKQLYYDLRVSGDGSRSCYSCHVQEKGLTDGLPKAIGAYGAALPRSSPTMWNVGYHTQFYWDGRSSPLEAQVRAAFTGGNMGVSGKDGRPSLDDIAAKLNAIPGYRSQFQRVFGGPATADNIVKATAAFVRTIVANDSAWAHFRQGHTDAFSEQARRGWDVFSKKARCTNCHDGVLLTDLQFHNVGIGWDAKKKAFADEGRFRVSNVEKDKGAFKTPTLLDISKSGPYFHDGSVATLEEAVDLMLAGGIKNPSLDATNLDRVRLTKQEREDLLAFLRSLDVNYTVTPPALPQ